MNRVFKYQESLQLYHVDAASRLFYGQLFFILHNAFAAFLKEQGFSIKDLLLSQKYFFPVVHAQANYSKPLFVGDLLEIDLVVEKIGTSSFTIGYDLQSAGIVVGDANIVHAAIDAKKHEKIELPDEFKKAIIPFIKNKVYLS